MKDELLFCCSNYSWRQPSGLFNVWYKTNNGGSQVSTWSNITQYILIFTSIRMTPLINRFIFYEMNSPAAHQI